MKRQLVSTMKYGVLLLVLSVFVALPMEAKASGVTGNTIMQKVSNQLLARKEKNVLKRHSLL